MDIVYRPMHLSDLEKVWELVEVLKLEKAGVSIVDLSHKEELKKWLSDDHIFLYIAEDGENVLSILRAIRGGEPGTRYAVLLTAATHPDYRNKGIAKELVLAGLEDMKKDGVSLARIYVYSDNLPSINTALRLGFTVSGTVYRHHYNEAAGEYVDDLIFYKLL